MFYIIYIDICQYVYRPRCQYIFRHFFRHRYPPFQHLLVCILAPMLVQFSAFFSASISTIATSAGMYFGPDACPIFGIFFGLDIHLSNQFISFILTCASMYIGPDASTYFGPDASPIFGIFFGLDAFNYVLFHLYRHVPVRISAPMPVQFSAFFSAPISTSRTNLCHLY